MEPEFIYIETPRLIIRISDFDTLKTIHQLYDDHALMSFYGFSKPNELEDAKSKVIGGMTTYRTKIAFGHLLLKSTQKVIGSCGFHNWFPTHQRAEIGYIIQDDIYKRNGYMKEAVMHIISYGFEKMNLIRIEAMVSPSNEASLRIIRSMGFQQEGILRSHWMTENGPDDNLIFGLLKSEWPPKK